MPVSQPVVTKPSQKVGTRPPIGPQNKTESNPFEFKDLRFPPEVGHDSSRLKHWIKFVPCLQQKSSYNVKKEGGAGGVMSITDTNRSVLGGQLGSTNDPFNDAAAIGVLGAGLSAIKGVEGIANADNPGEALSKGAGGAAAGFIGGAFAGAVIGSIDLTRKTRRAAASIALYMPDTVNQTIVNDYDQVSMTQALGNAGLVMQAGGSLLKGVKEAVLSENVNLGQTLGSAGGSEVAGAFAEKTGAFGSGITDVLLFSAGYAQNPQVELLFKTIQNREFLFDFKFVPKNRSEADEIIKIIQAFRFFAAPEIPTNGNGRYFVPPSEFDITFMLGGNRNPNLPRLASCVLQGIDVNYGSAGQWTAFADGMPVEISMQLRFKEVEIMHKELVKQGF